MKSVFPVIVMLFITSTVFSQVSAAASLRECIHNSSPEFGDTDEAKLSCIREAAATVNFDECKQIADTVRDTPTWDVAVSYCANYSAPSPENLMRACFQAAGGMNYDGQLACIRQHAAIIGLDGCRNHANSIQDTPTWDVAVGICELSARK